jgi:hypothetical protein
MSVLADIRTRLELGKSKYGHGVRVHMDTTTWGTPKNSWMEMAKEEFLDALVYVTADYITEGRKRAGWFSEMNILEANFIGLPELQQPVDDNDLILSIIDNKCDMAAGKHKSIVFNLVNILNAY